MTETFTPTAYRMPPAPKKSRKRFILPAALLVGGIIIGSAAAGSAEPEVRTVTKEVPGPEREVIKEVKVNVPTVPESCLTALTLSEQAFDYASESMGYMSDALTAAGNIDPAGIEQASGKLKLITPKLQALAPQVNTAKAECRAS